MVASSNSTANGLLKNFEDFQLSINNLYVQMKSPPGDLPNWNLRYEKNRKKQF